MAKTKKTKLNEVIFKSYQDVINKRMTAGHDVSGLTKRLNTLIAQHSNQFFSLKLGWGYSFLLGSAIFLTKI